MKRADNSYAILHFKQLVDLSSQACRCSSDAAAVPAVISMKSADRMQRGEKTKWWR